MQLSAYDRERGNTEPYLESPLSRDYNLDSSGSLDNLSFWTKLFRSTTYLVYLLVLLAFSAILLYAFKRYLDSNSDSIFWVLFLAMKISIVFLTMYLGGVLWLRFERQAIDNEIYRKDRGLRTGEDESLFEDEDEETEGYDLTSENLNPKVVFTDLHSTSSDSILQAYHSLLSEVHGDKSKVSLNEVAFQVYRKKGGFYVNKVKQRLIEKGEM